MSDPIVEIKNEILKILKEEKNGMMYSTIAERLNTSVPRISKYAQILAAEGKVEIIGYGQARVVKIKSDENESI